MTFYHRKLYALLRSPEVTDRGEIIVQQLTCLDGYRDELAAWWERSTNSLQVSQRIATSSDRLNLPSRVPAEIRVCHPISGQNQTIQALDFEQLPDYSDILQEEDVEKVFWWFWRLFPERIAQTQPDALLFPAHFVLPDCPLHSYQSTTSALTGALFPKDYQPGQPNCPPYLLLFSFSPVQEFIKASRKFLDFWAGSYLLHYLSARLCWYVAQQLGPDAIITPSLWSQEIIDTFLCQKYPDFKAALATLHSSQNLQGHDPVQRWQHRQSTSLSTAGFPNAIVVLVAGKPAAQALGKALSEQLVQEWTQIGTLIQQDIRSRIGAYAAKVMSHTQEWDKLWQKLQQDFENADDPQVYQRDLGLWQARPQPLSTDPQHCIYANWQWRELWEVQLKNTWEPYWTAIPLGKAQADLEIQKDGAKEFDPDWIAQQRSIAQAHEEIPSPIELELYQYLNVGTWWGSVQQRLRVTLDAVKRTRNWQIPSAPGRRSSISGQFTAVHPSIHYQKFAEGSGLTAGTMKFFWWLMAQVYPGLFDGKEQLNAIELTKRMAWSYGQVAAQLGIAEQPQPKRQPDYESLIRFPTGNLEKLIFDKLSFDG